MAETLIDPLFDSGPITFIPVDEWQCPEEDKIFKCTKGAIILNVSEFYNIFPANDNFDTFVLKVKRSYGTPDMTEHICQYINYFEKYYDTDKELTMAYYVLKYLIDYEPSYNKDAFFYDIDRYFMSGSIFYKAGLMNRDNYSLHLTYINKNNPNLQYNNKHAMILMKISLIINMIIPLLCHYMYMHTCNTTEFLMEIYDNLLSKFDTDIYNKIYETAISNVLQSERRNKGLWNLQDIRGNNTTTHALECCKNILINIIPKYKYSLNLVHFNYKSILRSTGYQVLDIEYEYSYMPLSSSKRDADNNSEFDKFESFLAKQDESLILQTAVSAKTTMNMIESKFGPFDINEISFYKRSLSDGSKLSINEFQKNLVWNLFYKYFGDPQSIKGINIDDYIKLIITAKKILESHSLTVLPYIISSKIVRLASRRNINKKELMKLEASEVWEKIQQKYNSKKIEKYIQNIIAQILTSEFQIIDYNDPYLNGKIIDVIPELIIEEVLLYILLI